MEREWQPVGGGTFSNENNAVDGPPRPEPGSVNTGENFGLPPAGGTAAKENPGALAGATGTDIQKQSIGESYPGAGAGESPSDADLLRQVVAANPDLMLAGFGGCPRRHLPGTKDRRPLNPDDPELVRQFSASRAWIEAQPRRKAMCRDRTSYGLKHLMPTYAYSGTFIAAAISLGLPYERRWDIGGDIFLPIWPSRKGGRA